MATDIGQLYDNDSEKILDVNGPKETFVRPY